MFGLRGLVCTQSQAADVRPQNCSQNDDLAGSRPIQPALPQAVSNTSSRKTFPRHACLGDQLFPSLPVD